MTRKGKRPVVLPAARRALLLWRITPLTVYALRSYLCLWCSFSFLSIMMYRLEAIELRRPAGSTLQHPWRRPPNSFEHWSLDSWRPLPAPWYHTLCPGIWVVQLSSGCLRSSWRRECCIKVMIAYRIVLDRADALKSIFRSQGHLQPQFRDVCLEC